MFDINGFRIEADKKLECELTIREGKIVYDLNGITNPVFVPANSVVNNQGSTKLTNH